jgi:hypothetical protein
MSCHSVTCVLRLIRAQACNYYVGSFWLLPMQFNALLNSNLNHAQVTALLKQISVVSGAEAIFKGMCFEMHGLEQDVRNAITMIMELDMVKVRSLDGYIYVIDP